MSRTDEWLEVLHSESLRYPDGTTEPAGPIREAALAYARELGWLDPRLAAEQDKAMAERDAVHNADRADAERIERARALLLESAIALSAAAAVLKK